MFEFIEVVPYFLKKNYFYWIIIDSFAESLTWRSTDVFKKLGDNTKKIINKYLLQNFFHLFLEALIINAPIECRALNADDSHKWLKKISLQERDGFWCEFLDERSRSESVVERLLNWAWSNRNYAHITDESVRLTSKMLCWFLASSNRRVRDKATRGLVCLLECRTQLIKGLLEDFNGIDDPYITERVIGIAYGCFLRNRHDAESLKEVANWVLKNVYGHNSTSHVLIRDYSFGIIELAVASGLLEPKNLDNITPPLSTEWPENIPSKEELEELLEAVETKGNEISGARIAYYSTAGFGDFSRYIIGTNSSSSRWSGYRLADIEKTTKENFDDFISNLNPTQRKKYLDYISILESFTPQHMIYLARKDNEGESVENDLKARKNTKILQGLKNFKDTLEISNRVVFEHQFEALISDRGHIEDPLEKFDLELAERWIFNRVLELGYNEDLHAEFDRMQNRNNNGRQPKENERIGKKYQWIAYYEYLGLMSDNFRLRNLSYYSSNNKPALRFTGKREIDISLLISTHLPLQSDINFQTKMIDSAQFLESDLPDIEWTKDEKTLPQIKNLIKFFDSDGDAWYLLNGNYNFEQNVPSEVEENQDFLQRNLWFHVRSYFVSMENIKAIFDWSKKQRFFGNWMPGSNHIAGDLFGEYGYHDDDLNDLVEFSSEDKDIPANIYHTCCEYNNFSDLDFSSENSNFEIKLPSQRMIQSLGLRNLNLHGRYFDNRDVLVAMDTGVYTDTMPNGLVFKGDQLIKMLEDNDLALFCTVVGEKNVRSSGMMRQYIYESEYNGVVKIETNNGLGKIRSSVTFTPRISPGEN